MFYDIEGVAPQDAVPVKNIVEERLGLVDPKLLRETINEVFSGQGYKENYIFTACPKRGTRVKTIYWMQVN